MGSNIYDRINELGDILRNMRDLAVGWHSMLKEALNNNQELTQQKTSLEQECASLKEELKLRGEELSQAREHNKEIEAQFKKDLNSLGINYINQTADYKEQKDRLGRMETGLLQLKDYSREQWEAAKNDTALLTAKELLEVLKDAKAEYDRRHKALDIREEIIKDSETELVERKSEIENIKKTLEEKENELAEKDNKYRELNSKYQELESEKRKLEERMASLEAQPAPARTACLDKVGNSIHNSNGNPVQTGYSNPMRQTRPADPGKVNKEAGSRGGEDSDSLVD